MYQHIYKLFFYVSLLLLSTTSHAQTMDDNTFLDPQDLSISFVDQGMGYGGLNAFGFNKDGRFSLVLRNVASTQTFKGMTGIGIYEGTLDAEGLERVAELKQLLCQPLKWPSMRSAELMWGYTVSCDKGKIYSDSVDIIQGFPKGKEKELANLFSIYRSLVAGAYQQATHQLAHLDIDYEIESLPHNYLVTLRFINSGELPIVLDNPKKWGAFPNPDIHVPNGVLLYISPSFSLIGEHWLNASDYPDDTITIPPGEVREATFMAIPNGKAFPVTQEYGGVALINVISPKALSGRTDFWLMNKSRTVPRKYPMTPLEWQEYEAKHRGRSFATTPKNTPFDETGYFRPYFSYQKNKNAGRFVTRFNQGDMAPSTSGQQSREGTLFPESDTEAQYWEWEADVAIPIEIGAGQVCPRAGIWWAIIPDEITNVERPIMLRCNTGENIPALGLPNTADEEKIRWVWTEALKEEK